MVLSLKRCVVLVKVLKGILRQHAPTLTMVLSISGKTVATGITKIQTNVENLILMVSDRMQCVVCAKVSKTLKSFLKLKSNQTQNLNPNVRVLIAKKEMNAKTATMALRMQMVMGVQSKLLILSFAVIKIQMNSHQVFYAAYVNQLIPA